MGIITKALKQTAVYWALAGDDSQGEDFDDHGRPQFLAPVEISCRWSDKREEYISANSITKISNSKVMVDRDMRNGEVLMLGELIDITEQINILENDNAWTIEGWKKTPNLKATEFLRVAYL